MPLIDHLSAPAPRLILRLTAFSKILTKIRSQKSDISRICEIGAGLGDAARLTSENFSTSSFDLFESSEDAREILSKRFAGDTTFAVHNDFMSTDERYDLALCFEVLEHIEDDKSFMNSIHNILDKDGVFCGSVPCYMSKWQAGDEYVGHFRRYEKDELHEKLKEAGFENIEITYYGFPLINLLYPWRNYYYSKQLKKRIDHDMEAATHKSGISRGLVMTFNKKFVLAA